MVQLLPLRQEAPKMVGIMWMFQTIAFMLVGLRLYTRLAVKHKYGIDDYLFSFSVFCHLVYVIMMTIATRFGLGQEMTNPGSYETSRALLLVNVGQTVTTMAVIAVKLSIGFFLLRIVGHHRGYKIAIMLPVTIMSLTYFIATWILWFSCTPINYVWDITTPGGHCDAVAHFWAGLVPGVMIVLVELWYATFPWYLVRGMQMPRREKILIGTSMSISYISAACSILRLLNLLKLAYADDSDFLLTIVDLLIWHSADITTQLFCIGITTCRPLYKNWLHRVADRIENVVPDDPKDPTHGAQSAPDAVALRTIGGHVVYRANESANGQGRSAAHSSRKAKRALRRNLVHQSDAKSSDFAESAPNTRTSDLEKSIH